MHLPVAVLYGPLDALSQSVFNFVLLLFISGICRPYIHPVIHSCTFFQNGADYVKKIKGIYCFKVKSGANQGVWVVDVKNGNGSVKFDPNGEFFFLIFMDTE